MSDLPEGYSIALGDLEDIAALISIDKAASALFAPTGLLEASALEDHVPAEVFEQEGALDRLNGFVAEHGAQFYRLPVNAETLTLRRGDPVTYPSKIDTADGPVTVFDPGFDLHWHVVA